jgi:hypothetical protein
VLVACYMVEAYIRCAHMTYMLIINIGVILFSPSSEIDIRLIGGFHHFSGSSRKEDIPSMPTVTIATICVTCRETGTQLDSSRRSDPSPQVSGLTRASFVSSSSVSLLQ